MRLWQYLRLLSPRARLAIKVFGFSFAVGALLFGRGEVGAIATNAVAAEPKPSPQIWEGGVNSLVAIAVGAAEGTRTVDGGKTRAYKGHTDPGNGVWNLGTFSYQHGAASPEEADEKQLKRLQRQAEELMGQAQEQGIELTLEESLNGIDLANQSPKAALSEGGFVDRLTEAKSKGLVGEEAIVWARTHSYMDPQTGQWNAPGLGNTAEGIERDQQRRADAVEKAIQANKK